MMIKTTYIPVLLILLFSCCTKISIEKQKTNNQIELGLSGSAKIISKADNIIPEGLSIGIYVQPKDSSVSFSKTMFSNRLYISETSGSLSGGPIFLNIGKDYDIYGYSPYQGGVTTPDSIAGFKNGDDVMIATNASIINVSETNNSAVLPFEHIVSQISFNVECEDTTVVIDQTSSIEVIGFYSSAVLNLTNTTLSPKGSAPSIKTNGSEGVLAIQPFCFFIKKSEYMDIPIKVTIKGITYNGSISRVFVAGESYKYTVTIPTTTHTLKLTSTLSQWVQVDGEVVVHI
ncbi:MAG: Fimbrillin-like [Bacteroidetes bacterium]|nr:Fimbrillin-like [Bacteroidota bacterium]